MEILIIDSETGTLGTNKDAKKYDRQTLGSFSSDLEGLRGHFSERLRANAAKANTSEERKEWVLIAAGMGDLEKELPWLIAESKSDPKEEFTSLLMYKLSLAQETHLLKTLWNYANKTNDKEIAAKA